MMTKSATAELLGILWMMGGVMFWNAGIGVMPIICWMAATVEFVLVFVHEWRGE